MTITQKDNLITALMILQGKGNKEISKKIMLTEDQICDFILNDVEEFNQIFWNLVEENNKLKARIFDDY